DRAQVPPALLRWRVSAQRGHLRAGGASRRRVPHDQDGPVDRPASHPASGPARHEVNVLRPGFWGPPTSTIDWCEANYAHSRYVCEWFNTLSSFAMVLAGFTGIWLHRRALERRFPLAVASV